MNLPFAVDIFLFFPPVMNIAMGIFVWQQRPSRGATASALMLLAAAWWATCYALQISAGDNLAAQIFWAKLRHVGLLIEPALVITFVVQYTDREKWLTPPTLLAMWGPPVIVLLFVFTNEWHGLYWTSTRLVTTAGISIMTPQRGVVNWLNFAYSYILLALATYFLLRWVVTNYQRIYRSQALVFVGSIIAPWLGNAVYISGLSFLDIAPFAFTLTGIGLAWAILGYRLLDLAPVARDRVVEELADGMFVIDQAGRLVDFNAAGLQLLGGLEPEKVFGQPAAEVFAKWTNLRPLFRNKTNIQTEVALGEGASSEFYLIQMAMLKGNHGRVFTVRNISERQKAAAALRRHNLRLAALYEIVLHLLNHQDQASLLQSIVEQATLLLDAPYGELMLIEGEELVVRAHTANQPFLQAERVSRGVAKLSWQAYDTRQTALVDDYSAWPHRRDIYSALPMSAVVAIPILAGDKALGVLDLARATPDYPFDEEQLQTANLFAGIAALVLENANMYAASQREIEGRRQVEKELASQRDFAMAIMNNMGQGLVVTGADGRYEYVNPVAARMAGLTPQEVIGRQPAEFIFPEDAAILAQASAIRKTGRTATYEIRIRRPDNNAETYVLMTSVPRKTTDGEIAGSIAVVTDLTERRRAEQSLAAERIRLRALIDSSRDGIILVGTDMTLQVINAPAIKLLGLPEAAGNWNGESLTYVTRILRRKSPALARVMLEQARLAQQGQLAPAGGETEGGSVALEWLNLPVQSGPNVLGRLVVLRDITEMRRLNQLRDDLTHTLIHDLRSPISGVLASLDLLQLDSGEAQPADRQQLLDMARQSAETMLHLVNTLLDISRLESRQVPLEGEQVALKVLVNHALSLQQPLALAKQVTIENDLSATLPLVWADPELIERVLQNLINNAIKFTPNAGVIKITAKLDTEAGETLTISVSNSGPGVPPELEGRLFEKFVTGLQRGRGTGLGLAFCRLAVEAHGGHIWLDRNADNLTVFTFSLPLHLVHNRLLQNNKTAVLKPLTEPRTQPIL
jgi:PAS domain S-box-containing protein